MKNFPHRLSQLCRVIAFVLVAGWSGSMTAATLLSVDLGTSAQSGFSLWNIGADGAGPRTMNFSVADILSVPLGSITGTIAAGTDPVNMANNVGAMNTRSRVGAPANSGAFTQSNLLTDRVVATSGAGLFLELSGFAASTAFTIQVWGFDTQATGGAKAGTFTLYDRTNGGNVSLGSFTSAAGALPADNNTFSVTASVTSDATGKIVVQSVSGMDGTGIMNGFVISTVPEPASGVFVAGSLLALGLIRRRRR